MTDLQTKSCVDGGVENIHLTYHIPSPLQMGVCLGGHRVIEKRQLLGEEDRRIVNVVQTEGWKGRREGGVMRLTYEHSQIG